MNVTLNKLRNAISSPPASYAFCTVICVMLMLALVLDAKAGNPKDPAYKFFTFQSRIDFKTIQPESVSGEVLVADLGISSSPSLECLEKGSFHLKDASVFITVKTTMPLCKEEVVSTQVVSGGTKKIAEKFITAPMFLNMRRSAAFGVWPFETAKILMGKDAVDSIPFIEEYMVLEKETGERLSIAASSLEKNFCLFKFLDIATGKIYLVLPDGKSAYVPISEIDLETLEGISKSENQLVVLSYERIEPESVFSISNQTGQVSAFRLFNVKFKRTLPEKKI